VTPAPTATAPATGDAAPALEELHQLYLASGLPCEWQVQTGSPTGASEVGYCLNAENSIAVYPTQAGVDALLQRNADSIEPGIFLVGDRWTVGSEHPNDLIQAQSTMGGELWPPDSEFFPQE
jgi:hypothetical protein